MAGTASYQQPYFEDYHSDASESGPARQSPPAPGQANVSLKRSHPSDLGADKAGVEKVSPDVASDSGYSSHTAATMSSADSAPSAQSRSPPVAPAAPVEPPPTPTTKRRPTLSADDRRNSVQSSPRRPLARTGSVSRDSKRPPPRVIVDRPRDRDDRRERDDRGERGERRSDRRVERREERRGDRIEERRGALEKEGPCNDPNCVGCERTVPAPAPRRAPSKSRRPRPSPLDSGLDMGSYQSFENQSHASDPAAYPPSSPIYTRNSVYAQGNAIVQPEISRRRSSSAARTRPASYHGGVNGWPGVSYPSGVQDRGPPPAMSAHYALHTMPMGAPMAPYGMMAPTPQANYFSGAPMPSPSPYDQRSQYPRPPSAHFNARRPAPQFGSPLITHDQQKQISNNMSARYAPQSAKQEKFPSRFDNSSSEEGSSEEEEVDNSRAIMPMAPPPKPTRRPSLRPQVYQDDRMSQSQTLPERPRELQRMRAVTTDPARASSTSRANRRPSLVQRPGTVSYDSPGNARILVESARNRRRDSYVGPDVEYRTERKSRLSAQIYDQDYESVAQPTTRRRATDGDRRRREKAPAGVEENTLDAKAREAEAYQRDMRGGDISQLTDQSLKVARRSSRVPSGASETGSSRSEKASRISQARTTMTNGGSGEIRLRVDGTAPISLQFNGELEGRTISLNPVENGMTDVVIGPGPREITYPSERGSIITTPRKLLTRRETDDVSARSYRSTRTRDSREIRESDRKPLRRRQYEEYDDEEHADWI